MVTSVFAGTVALSGTAVAGTLGNVSVSASPNTPGATATHTVSVEADSDLDGQSLTSFVVNTDGSSNVDYSSVTESDISLLLNGSAYTGNISGVSTSNGGSTLNIDLDGSGSGLNEGTNITAVVDDATNPSNDGSYSFTIGVSGTSTGTGSLTVGTGTNVLPTDVDDNTRTSSFIANDNFSAADLSFDSAGNVTNVTVDLSAGSNASGVTAAQFESVTVTLHKTSGATVSETRQYDTLSKQVSFGSAVTNVERITLDVTARSENFLEASTVVDAVLTLQTNPTRTIDTAGFQRAAIGTDTGVVLGDVKDTNNNDITGEEVFVLNLDTGVIEASPVTDNQGEYTTEVPPGANYTAFIDNVRFEQFPTDEKFVPRGESRRIDIRVRRLQIPTDIEVIDVDPNSATAPADGTSQITYTVQVLDQNGNPIPGVNVTASVDSGRSITLTPTQNTTAQSTNATQFRASSDVVQTAVFNFSVTNFPSVFTTAEGEFGPLNGEGYVIGEVWDITRDVNHGLENATVYATTLSTFVQNSQSVFVPSQATEARDNTNFYRLINSTTGEVINYNNYRVDNNGANSDLHVGPVRELNVTDRSEGSGFFVVNRLAADNDAFVTPLEPGEYTLQHSFTAPNASRFGDSTAPEENFRNISTFTVSQDLTEDRASDLTNRNTGPILVDETDEEGKYALRKMYADGQAGINYVLIAQKAGYERDYVVAEVTEDGALFDDGEDSNFELRPRDVQPDFVNITNVGLLQDGSVVEFDNMTDAYFQQVPRDGSIDVIDVTVRSDEEGQKLNGTVTLEVPDDDTLTTPASEHNFSGAFINVDGGEIVDTGEDTVTLYTGDDGEARVYLQTDQSAEDLERRNVLEDVTGVSAVLANDATATDFTNKSFVGVVRLESASVSGIVTDRDDTRVPRSVVYVRSFELSRNFRVTFRPGPNAPPRGTPGFGDWIVNQNSEFVVRLQKWNSTTLTYETINTETAEISRISDWSFQNFTNTFPSLTLGTSLTGPGTAADGFDFWDNTTADADYTLDPVPAANASVEGFERATDYTVDAVRTNVPAGNENAGKDANDGTASVRPQTTDDANVVFPFQVEPAFFVVNSLDAPQSLTAGDELSLSATLTNEGGTQGSLQQVQFRVDTNGDGELTADETLASQQVQLSPGTTDTIEFTVPGSVTSTLSEGDVKHGVFTDDTSQTATITVESGTSGPSLSDYTNENGVVDDNGLSQAIDDWVAGTIGDGLLSDVIDAWVSGQPVS